MFKCGFVLELMSYANPLAAKPALAAKLDRFSSANACSRDLQFLRGNDKTMHATVVNLKTGIVQQERHRLAVRVGDASHDVEACTK